MLVMLWLLASEDESQEGKLPDAKHIAFRLRMPITKVNQALTKLNHWLYHDDINTISERYQDGLPETETETETENKKQKQFDALRHLVSLGVVEQVARDWIKQRKTKPTLTAIKGIEKEASKARMSLHQALEISCSRGWQSFKAEWIQDKTNTLTPNQSAWLTITGQTANFGDDNHGRTIEADPLPPALLG